MATIVLPKDQLEKVNEYLDIAGDHTLDAFEDQEDLVSIVIGFMTFLKKHPEGVAIVSKDSFNDLIEDRDWRIAMESAGVDNWDGCDYAMEILAEMNEEE